MTDHFPLLISDLSRKYENYTLAFAQLRTQGFWNDRKIQIRMQCPLIFYEFTDGTEFGKDPLGLLFYHNVNDFEVGDSNYKVTYVDNSPCTVMIDFYETLEDANNDNAYATWIASVNTRIYRLPPASNKVNSGFWKNSIALTCQGALLRVTDSQFVHVYFKSIRKQVYFTEEYIRNSDKGDSVNGYLIARDISRLTGRTSADYAPDRIVFFTPGKPQDVIALFLPDTLAAGLGTNRRPVIATWELYNPSTDGVKALDALHKPAADHHTEGLESAAEA